MTGCAALGCATAPASTPALTPCTPPAAPPESAAVAEVAPAVDPVVALLGGVAIRQSEVDRTIPHLVARERVRSAEALHTHREAALDGLIAERLLAAEAERRGLTAEALLAAEVEAKLVAPSEAAIAAFYAKVASQVGGAPLDEVREPIVAHLMSEAAERREQAYVSSLRRQGAVSVKMVKPRVALPPAAPDAPFAKGAATAPVTITVFSDFECPYCSRAATVVDDVYAAFPDAVRLVHRHFPLAMHDNAELAARAAVCAGRAGRFWELSEALFAKQRALSPSVIRGLLASAGVDGPEAEACLQAAGSEVDADVKAGDAAAVSGTPALFVNGLRVSGSWSEKMLRQMVEAELARIAHQTSSEIKEARSPSAWRRLEANVAVSGRRE